MANAAGFSDAVGLSQSTLRLGVGCHVVLVDGTPVLSATEISSLVTRANGGSFRDGLTAFALRALRHQLDPEEIEAEATAQIRKLCAAGIAVTHLDTHKHTHIFPRVLESLVRAAKNCGIRAIRNPFGPLGMMKVVDRPALWMRWGRLGAYRDLEENFGVRVRAGAWVRRMGRWAISSTV